MRCLNCHMVLMATDRVCPSCRMAAPNVGLAASNGGIVPRRTCAFEVWMADVGSKVIRVPALRWAAGLFLFLVAGAVMLLGRGYFLWNQSDGERGPREVTATELIDLPNRGPMPDPWISYSFSKYCETGVRLQKRSVGNQYAYSQFILVQVQDRWLVAQVPPDFRGNKLVGRVQSLGSFDGSSYESHLDKKIITEILDSNRNKADRLLPYQVNAVLPFESKIRSGNTIALIIALGGLIIGGLGLTIIRAKPQPR